MGWRFPNVQVNAAGPVVPGRDLL